jgi:hypothetical protein
MTGGWGIFCGMVVFFAFGLLYGFFPCDDPHEARLRRRARREYRREQRLVMRCRKTQALSALHKEVCPEDHGHGTVVLVEARRKSSVRLSILGGLIEYNRDPG